MILKITNALLIATILVSAWMIYSLEYRIRAGERRIVQLQAQIAEEEATTKLLAAEWALLTNPARIEKLVEKHLPGLQPLKPQQLTDLAGLDAKLPARGLPAEAADDPIAKMLEVLQ